ncbi:MAG: acetate/propionate family kinase [Halofilum sp. (in: g-proteobacteria)]|nr:acetate/propionate family kinase [Halofilum sp. (in: g-proteobacteria)]
MPENLLTVNAGSSSIRLMLYRHGTGKLVAQASHHDSAAPDGAAELLTRFLSEQDAAPVDMVVHRVVHGGDRGAGAHRLDAEVERTIERYAPLAPLHNPAALAWVRSCREVLGDIPGFAVFDTSLYRDLPAVARTYALPHVLTAAHGLRRYGFHGIAHEAMWHRWRTIAPTGGERVISLQLGSGCSITALRNGRAVDTSMGFSPLEGLVMATRSGDVDPGLLLHLQREHGLPPERLETMLNRESGLLGVSGISGDMRELIAADTEAARLALDLYAYRARKYIGAFLTVLGGADAILFGGGVGEHQPQMRAAILEGLEWAGIDLDRVANEAATGGESRISTPDSGIEVRVIEVDESEPLARAALAAYEAEDKQGRNGA